MNENRYSALAPNSNALWLTFPRDETPLMIRSQLLGLGPDHALLCALPEGHNSSHFVAGSICKGRSSLDGDTYQFETTIREVLKTPPALLLTPPRDHHSTCSPGLSTTPCGLIGDH